MPGVPSVVSGKFGEGGAETRGQGRGTLVGEVGLVVGSGSDHDARWSVLEGVDIDAIVRDCGCVLGEEYLGVFRMTRRRRRSHASSLDADAGGECAYLLFAVVTLEPGGIGIRALISGEQLWQRRLVCDE